MSLYALLHDTESRTLRAGSSQFDGGIDKPRLAVSGQWCSVKKERMEVRALGSYILGIISGTPYLGHQNKAGCSDRAKGCSQ